jgi:dihydroxyacetone kinase-like predicted kinase
MATALSLFKWTVSGSETVRAALKERGESLIVTGDESTLKVHIHCLDPGPVIHYCVSLGTISAVSIRNMDEQYQDMLKQQTEGRVPVSHTGVVAIATGEGIMDAFNGWEFQLLPGDTMNPVRKYAGGRTFCR